MDGLTEEELKSESSCSLWASMETWGKEGGTEGSSDSGSHLLD